MKKIPYEILFRGKPDGSAFNGISVTDEPNGMPRPITLEELRELFGESTATLLAETDRLEKKVVALEEANGGPVEEI